MAPSGRCKRPLTNSRYEQRHCFEPVHRFRTCNPADQNARVMLGREMPTLSAHQEMPCTLDPLRHRDAPF